LRSKAWQHSGKLSNWDSAIATHLEEVRQSVKKVAVRSQTRRVPSATFR
jgi:hypothetical protein